MRRTLLAGMLASSACLAQSVPTQDGLKTIIQAQLDHEPAACVSMFNKKDPTGHLVLKVTRGFAPPKFETYYAHGLLTRQDTHVALGDASILPVNALFAKRKNAWRYDWAAVVSANVVDDELCYGYHKLVDQIERWTDPKDGEITVQYTWHFEKVADWAKQDWLRDSDPDVWHAATEKEASAIGTVTRFNDGWR